MHRPSVTLALPAYNEEKRLEKTVLTLLAQTHSDFEFLLGDNCSTDDTMKVMLRLASMDSRIRVLPSPKNGGAVWNFRRLLEHAKGEYFAWVGAHDYYKPNWLEELLNVISADERIVLTYPSCLCLLPDFTVFKTITLPLDTRNMDVHERVRYLCGLSSAGTRIYGLFRTHAVRNCPVETVIRWDSLFLARMAFRGDVVSLDQPLWYRFYEQVPEPSLDMYRTVLRRQYRSVYASADDAPILHFLPVYYHLFCLIKDGLNTALRRGPAHLALTYSACRAYYTRSKKNIVPELCYCADQCVTWTRQHINKLYVMVNRQTIPHRMENN